MKQIPIIFLYLALVACQRRMAPWPYEGDRQPVTLQTRTAPADGFSGMPSDCQLFVYDQLTQRTEMHNATREGSLNCYRVKLFPGIYTAYCTTHAAEKNYWEYNEENTPETILLKSQTQGGSRDHFLGVCELDVQPDIENTIALDLERKVAQLLIVIHNHPDWLEDLQIKVSNIPRTLSLTGNYSSSTHTVTTDASLPANGLSTTRLLLFPPREGKNGVLSLSSRTHAYTSEEYDIRELAANRITRIDITFDQHAGLGIIELATSTVDWDKDTIKEEWETPTPIPLLPCEGSGNGYNLVENAGFEFWRDTLPTHWKLNSSGKSRKVSRETDNVREGNCAVRLNGATYLYQDIPVSGGACYQLQMFVSALSPDVKWRYWCTWMEGSTPLNAFSEELHPSDYRHETDGYIDAMEGIIVRAPADATALRMEIRTYTGTPERGEGLSVDGIRAELVE